MWFFKKKKLEVNPVTESQTIEISPEPVARYKVVEKEEIVELKKWFVHIQTKSRDYTTKVKTEPHVDPYNNSPIVVDLVTGHHRPMHGTYRHPYNFAPDSQVSPKQIIVPIKRKVYYNLELNSFFNFRERNVLSFIEYGTDNQIILPVEDVIAICIEPEVNDGEKIITYSVVEKINGTE